jgi:hypothetical protein
MIYFSTKVVNENIEHLVLGFEVLTAASMKMAVFWVGAPCSLVEIYRRMGEENSRKIRTREDPEDSCLLGCFTVYLSDIDRRSRGAYCRYRQGILKNR